MEEISEEDGGNISRRWRKYLEKMEEISREDGGNISRRWRKEQVDECGELPSMHCAQFWSPTTTFVEKLPKVETFIVLPTARTVVQILMEPGSK